MDNEAQVITINDRVIDLNSGEIVHAGQAEQLPPRLLCLLKHFIAHRNQVILRDDLIASVWGHLEAASEDSVNVAVSALRKALGDLRRPHHIIKTVPRRGYRFVLADTLAADATTEADGAAVPAAMLKQQTPALVPRRWLLLLVILALLPTLWLLLPEPANNSLHGGGNAAAEELPSVAVLPFTDMSNNRNQSQFADGLADRILHMLTETRNMRVVARTSSFAFRDSPLGIGDIGRQLGVDAVLEGSVQHDGEQMRVVAQLIDVDNEQHIWSRTFDRDSAELFALQDDIANAVTASMVDSLLPASVLQPPVNRTVYDLNTRASFEIERFTVASLKRGRNLLQRALQIDPDNLDSLLLLIQAEKMLRTQGPMRQPGDADIVLPHLQQAIELAPNDPGVLLAQGAWQFGEGKPELAIASYRQAIAQKPNFADAYTMLGRVLYRIGRMEEADDMLDMARRLDPVSPQVAVWQADALWAIGRAEEAVFQLHKNLQLFPNYPLTYDRLATYLLQQGESGLAMRYILEQHRIDPDSPVRWFRMCEFYLQLGDDISAETCTDELASQHHLPVRLPYMRQILHSFRGEWQAQQEILESIIIMHPYNPLNQSLLAQSYTFSGDCDQAEQVLQQSYPGVYAAPPQITPPMTLAAISAAYCALQDGADPDTSPLLQKLTENLERMRLAQGPWQVTGHQRARLLAMQGRHDDALQELDKLINSGWRYYWWRLDAYPEFAALAERPEFIALQQQLEAGVATQRAWFEANRDVQLASLD
ncbi:MAG: tetratricopeptide repeat protein [Gammaproteobacteria bacterium]|nr:tetratricopeptide repeat protein [Gammaproteobacteria bacterium]